MSNIVKDIYYVSDLGTDTVSIIDGEKFSLISKIKIGSRPCDIAIDNKNNGYIATDRNNKIQLIDCEYNIKKVLDIPNNGVIKVDSLLRRIYVSNIDELNIYSLDTFEFISKISGFSAINGIEISDDGSNLFILDTIENEVKFYDSKILKLKKVYSNFISPNYMVISSDNKYIYVSDKIIINGIYNYIIKKIELESSITFQINMPIGTVVTYLEIEENNLYVVNKGLERIDVIDTIKNQLKDSITTTFKYPERIKLINNSKYLLITNHDCKGNGSLDLINLNNKVIENTFKFEEQNSIPSNVVIIREIITNNEVNVTNELNNKESKQNIILAKKVIATYKEKIIFQNEMLEVNSNYEIEILKVDFDKCIAINESKFVDYVEAKNNYITFNFEFYIPYYINCINLKRENIVFKGNLSGRQKALFYIGNKVELNELEFNIKALNILMTSPYVENGYIVFDVKTIITTYVTKEAVIYLPYENE